MITRAEIAETLGQSYEPDEGTASTVSCTLQASDGLGFVSMTTSPAPTPAVFASLVSGPDPVSVDGIGDEAKLWFDGQPTVAVLVARRGGSAVTVRLTGPVPEPPNSTGTSTSGVDREPPTSAEVSSTTASEKVADPDPATTPDAEEAMARDGLRRRIIAASKVVVARLPEAPFDAEEVDTSVADETCRAVDPADVAELLDVAVESVSVRGLGTGACEVGTAEGTNAVLELAPGEATVDDLARRGRTVVVDGVTHVWEPEVVEGVGDGAVWLLDPATGSAGELYALFGNRILRVGVNAPSDDRDLRGYAVGLASSAGPALVD